MQLEKDIAEWLKFPTEELYRSILHQNWLLSQSSIRKFRLSPHDDEVKSLINYTIYHALEVLKKNTIADPYYVAYTQRSCWFALQRFVTLRAKRDMDGTKRSGMLRNHIDWYCWNTRELLEHIRKYITNEIDLQVLDFVLAGYNQTEIGDIFGVTHQAIQIRVKRIRRNVALALKEIDYRTAKRKRKYYG